MNVCYLALKLGIVCVFNCLLFRHIASPDYKDFWNISHIKKYYCLKKIVIYICIIPMQKMYTIMLSSFSYDSRQSCARLCVYTRLLLPFKFPLLVYLPKHHWSSVNLLGALRDRFWPFFVYICKQNKLRMLYLWSAWKSITKTDPNTTIPAPDNVCSVMWGWRLKGNNLLCIKSCAVNGILIYMNKTLFVHYKYLLWIH